MRAIFARVYDDGSLILQIGKWVTLAEPQADELQSETIAFDGLLVLYATRDYIRRCCIPAPGTHSSRRVTRFKAHRRSLCSASELQPSVPAWLLGEGRHAAQGEAIMLADVLVANTESPEHSGSGDGAPSRVPLDIAWRAAPDGSARVVEKRVNPAVLLSIESMPSPSSIALLCTSPFFSVFISRP